MKYCGSAAKFDSKSLEIGAKPGKSLVYLNEYQTKNFLIRVLPKNGWAIIHEKAMRKVTIFRIIFTCGIVLTVYFFLKKRKIWKNGSTWIKLHSLSCRIRHEGENLSLQFRISRLCKCDQTGHHLHLKQSLDHKSHKGNKNRKKLLLIGSLNKEPPPYIQP